MNTLIILVVVCLVLSLVGVMVLAVHLEALAQGVYSDDQVERIASEHFRNSHARRNQSFDIDDDTHKPFALDTERDWT